jgi:4-aminobutyrate aminotransferase
MKYVKIVSQPPGPEVRKFLKKEEDYVSLSMERDYPVYTRWSEGGLTEDYDGNRYLDFTSSCGTNSIGARNQELVDVAKKQLDTSTLSGWPHMYEEVTELAEKLTKITPGDFAKKVCFLCDGGQTADAAYRLARFHQRRTLFCSFIMAHHGTTLGAASVSGHFTRQKLGYGPLVPGFIHLPYPYPYRCMFGTDNPEDCAEAHLDYIENTIFNSIAPPLDIAGLFTEPISGPGGAVVIPPKTFHPKLKKLCEKHGIIYVADEVMTGFGRTGKMFATEHWGVAPDIIGVGKALGNGIVPVSAIVFRKEYENPKSPYGIWYHGGSMHGYQLGCAISLKVLELMERERLPERSSKLGEHALKRCQEMQEKHEIIGDVRGKGLLIGIEYVKNRRTKEPARDEATRIEYRSYEKGVLTQLGGLKWCTQMIYPPLTISEDQLDEGLDIIEEAIDDVEKGRVRKPDLPYGLLYPIMGHV